MPIPAWIPARVRKWRNWLPWATLALAMLAVLAYQLWHQLVLDPGRPLYLFWLETLTFGLLGPVVAWLLLGQLARHAAAEELAAQQIDALRAQERYLLHAVAGSADGIVGLDPNDRILTWNHGAEVMFGCPPSEVIGEPLSALLDPGEDGAGRWAEARSRVAETGAVRDFEVLARTKRGRALPVEITHTLVRDDNGRLLGSAAIVRDISGRKALAAEEQRRTQELAVLYAITAAMNAAMNLSQALDQALERVLDVLDLTSGKVYLLDRETGQLTLSVARNIPGNEDDEERTIMPGECLCGIAALSGEILLAADVIRDPRIIRTQCLRRGHSACAAVPLLARDQMLGVLHVAADDESAFSPSGMALLRSVGAQIGVSMENLRLREEARRAEALSTLIQEMHHRIKNNLQTVADLLSLEMSAAANPAAAKSLRDSVNRIKSIAAVHQLLSLEQLRLTNITELARQVCDISQRHLVQPGRQVSAEIGGPAIYLPSKQATALALVMNELVTNAFEHAFAPGEPGHVRIMLDQRDEEVSVTVEDNGRGLPPGFNLETDTGLGLQIVRTLVEKDLAGTLRMDAPAGGGSRTTLTFYK